MKMHLRVTEDYGLVPIDDKAVEYLFRRRVGTVLACEVVQERNYQFHKKAMALVKIVHDALPEPNPIMFKGEMIQPEHTFDMTRKWLTVQAGWYDVYGTPKGDTRIEAKSWKFNKMSAEEFEKFYSSLIDASLKALPESYSAEELERLAMQVIQFV